MHILTFEYINGARNRSTCQNKCARLARIVLSLWEYPSMYTKILYSNWTTTKKMKTKHKMSTQKMHTQHSKITKAAEADELGRRRRHGLLLE